MIFVSFMTLPFKPISKYYVCSRLFRRPIYLVAAFIISFFGFVTAAAPNFPLLVFIRFMVGFGR